jgi:hypothetical protein
MTSAYCSVSTDDQAWVVSGQCAGVCRGLRVTSVLGKMPYANLSAHLRGSPMRIVAAIAAVVLGSHCAFAEVTDADLMAKFKATWRAQDGMSADEIVSNVERVARFIPRGWKVVRNKAGDRLIELSWAMRRQDEPGKEYTIEWVAKNDGASFESRQYGKIVDLGWQALALSLIGDDIANEEPKANKRFALDNRNYNFISIPQGKLGDILSSNMCVLNTPMDVSYVPATNVNPGVFRVQVTVDCRTSKLSPRTGDIIMGNTGTGWVPSSFFMKQFYRQ